LTLPVVPFTVEALVNGPTGTFSRRRDP